MDESGPAHAGQAEVADVDRIEEWLLARGVPHFIHDYNAAEDVFTRTLPVLTLVFVVEVFGALNLEWVWWVNVAAVAAGTALLGGLWAGANRLRGRRPLARPDDVGPHELAFFVLAPAVLPLVFGGQAASAAVTVVGNLLTLGVVYLVTVWGLVPMGRWAAGQLALQARELLGLLARALPLLLLFVTFLFINAEVWEVASRMAVVQLAAATAVFVLTGLLFLVARLPQDLDELGRFDAPDDMRAVVAGTPAATLAVPPGATTPPPLGRWEQGNVALLLLVAQALQVLSVAVLIGGFFVLFGVITVGPTTVEGWTGLEADVLAALSLGDADVVLTEQLLRVAGFLGAFSGLYFAVVAVTDDTYRAQFRAQIVDDVRQALAVRALYLSSVGP